MDVRLPNGVVLKNVPEGTSKAELREKAIKNGLARPEDFTDVPVVTEEDSRALLEANMENAEAQRAEADRMFEASKDTVGENLYEGAAGAANTTVVQGIMPVADLLTSFPRAAYNIYQRGTGGEEISSVMDLLGDYDPRKGTMPEERGAARAAEIAGLAPVAAAAMAPRAIQGAMGAGDVLMDIAGLGSTEAKVAGLGAKGQKAAYDMARKTMDDAVEMRPRSTPNAAREDITGNYDFSTDEGVAQAANDINDELIYGTNVENLPEYQAAKAETNAAWEQIAKIDAKLAKLEEKGATTGKRYENLEAKKAELFAQSEASAAKAPEFVPKAENQNLRMYEVLEQRYGLNPVEAAKQIARQGGLRPASGFEEIMQRQAAMNKKMYDGSTAYLDETGVWASTKQWAANAVRPVSELVSDRVGGLIGRKFENAFETAARNTELFSVKFLPKTEQLDGLRKWADTDEIKAQFLDLRQTGEAGKNRLIAEASTKISREAGKMLREMFEEGAKHQKETRRLYRKEVQMDEVFWPSMKRMETDEAQKRIDNIKSEADFNAPRSLTGAQERARKMGFEMEAEELATYENPLAAFMDRINKEQTLVQLAKQFDMAPSIAKADDTNAFFDALEAKFLRESGDKRKAQIGRNLIQETYRGMRKAPNNGVQLFTKQMYAGTLGQLDSAVLNLHDVAVSMLTNGVKPTLRAVLERGGTDIRKLGITNDVRSLGEFREGFDKVFERSSFEKGLDWYSDKAFKWSGFQTFDRMGKGTVLRAALNSAQEAAGNGTLMQKFGYMMEPRELAEISRVLKNKTPLEKMTPRQQELATQLMFSRLGEQQLISSAGRPLFYLKHPNFRFAFAMSGFAIKQGAMMHNNIYKAAARGDYAAAGEWFAKYMMTAGIGFGIINQMRGTMQYALGNEDKKPSLAGFATDVALQPVSALTFNRLGDTYSLGQFKRDPVGAALESFVPPTGLVGNLGQDIVGVFTENGMSYKTLRSIPYGDELLALIKD